MPDTPITPPPTPPINGVRTTQVWFVQGKKANQTWRTALQLLRENATLHEENKENIPPDVEKADPKYDKSKET